LRTTHHQRAAARAARRLVPKTEASRSASTCLVMLNSVMLIGVGLEVTPRCSAGFARDPVTVTGLAPIHRSARRNCLKRGRNNAPTLIWPVCGAPNGSKRSVSAALRATPRARPRLFRQSLQGEFSEIGTVFSHPPCGERDIADTRRRTVPLQENPVRRSLSCYPLVARSKASQHCCSYSPKCPES
jgi:hypothetical protein